MSYANLSIYLLLYTFIVFTSVHLINLSICNITDFKLSIVALIMVNTKMLWLTFKTVAGSFAVKIKCCKHLNG